MPWFRVDDNLSFHAKVVAAGNPAMGLWVRAGAWSALMLTDGFVPDHMIRALGTKQQADRLSAVGLMKRAQGGYRFHEWAERQPSKASVSAERAAARERMRLAREARKGGKPQVSEGSSKDVQPNDDGTSGEVLTTLPSPALPIPKRGVKRGAETPIPDAWQPTAVHRDYALSNGVDLSSEVFKFRNHAIANDRRQVRWDATFSTWLAKAKDYAPKQSPRAHRDDIPEAWR